MNFSFQSICLGKGKKKIKPLQTVVLPTNHVSRCSFCLFKVYFKHYFGHFVHYEQRRVLHLYVFLKCRKKYIYISIHTLGILSTGNPHINCLFSHQSL